MIASSSIEPDVELRDFLRAQNIRVGLSGGGSELVKVYGDWERSTNDLPNDFIVIYKNGEIGGVGMNVDYADGYIMVSIYSKMNDDGSVKKNRTKKLLKQIDDLFLYKQVPDDDPIPDDKIYEKYKPIITDNYIFKHDAQRFITPTTPNQTSGYSVTTLNLMWHTRNNFNSE